MSGPAIVNAILSANAPVTLLVPAARILTVTELPLKIILPAISIMRVTGGPYQYVDGPSLLHRDQVQITAHAASDTSKEQILRKVRAALASIGAVRIAGIWVDSIVVGAEGPDMSQPDAGLFEQSVDALVRFNDPS